MRPPIVERGPWKPAKAVSSVPEPQNWIGDILSGLFDGLDLIELIFAGVRFLGHVLLVGVRVAFHLLTRDI